MGLKSLLQDEKIREGKSKEAGCVVPRMCSFSYATYSACIFLYWQQYMHVDESLINGRACISHLHYFAAFEPLSSIDIIWLEASDIAFTRKTTIEQIHVSACNAVDETSQ